MADFDFSELEALSASVAAAAARLPREVRPVVAKGALNIKTGARKRISNHPTWKHLASTLNYEMTGSNAAQAVAVVGYDDVGQGELAGIAEFGSARHAPHPALFPAAKDEAPRFAEALAKVAAKAIEDAL